MPTFLPGRSFGATSTDYNLADKGFLAMVELNPQILGIGIATILTRDLWLSYVPYWLIKFVPSTNICPF